MLPYQELLDRFVSENRKILGDNLVGVYLHGSAAMGCFHPETGDLDLLTVVNDPLSDETKRAFLNATAALNEDAPKKGLELSVLRKAVCSPFVYPTPYELHFSAGYLSLWRHDPEEYLRRLCGVDSDLAAHVTILRARGKTLFGAPIEAVFGEVSPADYFDSILFDVEDAAEDVLENPMYVILNLCRVLAYREEGKILSKEEGGQWGLARLPEEYRPLIARALAQYAGGVAPQYEAALSQEYAGYMLERIRSAENEAED